ncbi:HSP20-like chaperone [Macrolepiota fuliginosa MF-IS2]|uniref:HSP20-like chaperone n=1 Tax=Macrolepiota fuliginosa MF-IS2 TaxID=1400762 RepID=A0A9P5XNS0_9AGAR|nr:HSP20-like chaperone [Macrolepiota fuliginosa MF-IS2]
MSIARQLFREFRPLIRMLDEPFGRTRAHLPAVARNRDHNDLFTDSFAGLNMLARPAVDVTEKGDKYVLDADLPGVSRDNLEVRIGDGNQSITIEGKVTEMSGVVITFNSFNDKWVLASQSTSLAKTDKGETQISVERPYSRNYSFTRTVWLPRPVDPNNVTAKLQNGVLNVTLNKAVDETSKVVNIEEVQ